MKTENNIEKVFKEKLQNFEAPYDASAWQAMSAILDAKGGVGAGAAATSSKLLTWAFAGVAIVAVSVGGYFFFKNDKVAPESNQLSQVVSTDDSANDKVQTKIEQGVIVEKNSQENGIADTDEIIHSNTASETVEGNKTQLDLSDNNKEERESTTTNSTDESNVVTTPQTSGKSTIKPTSKTYVSGFIAIKDVCENQMVTIRNPETKTGNVRFEKDGRWIELRPTEAYGFKALESEEITFVNAKNEAISVAHIKVNPLPSVNFGYKANIFEEGLPVTVCEAYGNFNSYEWTFDDEVIKGKEEIKYNFFEKGAHQVKLTVKDANNCESTIEKNIEIREKYNLMAVNTFKPNDMDLRNTTFMPYSLTERAVKFYLTIVDPTDNGVVFVSSDAENAWDGTDQRNGKMTPAEKVYIWKVQIYNPEKNERPIYSGTIIHD